MSSYSILTMKVLLMSSGAVSLAMAFKFTVLPFIVDFTVSELPTVWSVLVSLFKPPYLYIVVNGIIITIAASSLFTTQSESSPPPPVEHSRPLISAKTPAPMEISHAIVFPAEPAIKEVDVPVVEDEEQDVEVVYEDRVFDVKRPVMVNGLEVIQYYEEGKEMNNEGEEAEAENNEEEDEEEVEAVEAMPTHTQPQTIVSHETDSALAFTEKPLGLSRFGHGKPLEACTEDRRKLRAAKPKKEMTLESTWRMITEKHHVPLTRQLKKSETFGSRERNVDATELDYYENYAPPKKYVRKSETFKDRVGYLNNSAVSSAMLRKEPSLDQDELNRRVEAFINKFNEEMRLQRQESLKQYMEMINRGSAY